MTFIGFGSHDRGQRYAGLEDAWCRGSRIERSAGQLSRAVRLRIEVDSVRKDLRAMPHWCMAMHDELAERDVGAQEFVADPQEIGGGLIGQRDTGFQRSEEHTSELQSLMRISYAVFCLKKKTKRLLRHTRQNKYRDKT